MVARKLHASLAKFVHFFVIVPYLAQACGDLSSEFCALEDAIRKDFLPSIRGGAVCDAKRDLCLPAKMGGLGLPSPAK